MPKLTKRTVTALQPPFDPRGPATTYVWDSEIKGFGIGVGRSGTKSFVIQYRNRNGQSRRKVIGRFGIMTAEEARKVAIGLLGDVARGCEPVFAPKEEASGYTVAEICAWFMERAREGKIIGRSRRPIKATTLAMDESRINAHILPLLGDRRIDTLKLGDIEAAQADIANGLTAKPRSGSRGGVTTGGEGVAARAMGTLHSILEHAVRLGEIEKNPARGIRRLASKRKMRWLSQAELARLGTALREAEADNEHPTAIAVIRFLLLTGFRRLEALSLERSWLLDEEHAIHFETTKTGPQRRVIGEVPLALLLSQPARSPKYFFPADVGDGHFIGVVRVLQRICARADLHDVTLHVFRHTFASVAGGLGYSELTIAALLGHASRGVTQRYIHIDEPLRAAATKVSDHIAGLLGEPATPVQLQGRIEPLAVEETVEKAGSADESCTEAEADWVWLCSR